MFSLLVSERSLSTPRSGLAPSPSLRRDEDGAIMLMGLFFACLLIAAMWSMKGIGDAIVFRNRMQEGADHEVYAAAVIHARGMNLVSALNVVMKVITLIYLVMSVVRDLLALAMALLAACAATVFGAIVCGGLLGAATVAYNALTEARNVYQQTVVQYGLPLVSGIETAATIAYPWYGSAMAADVAGTYDSSGVAVGSSHVPGLSFDVSMDSMFDEGDSTGATSCRASALGEGSDRQAGVSKEDQDSETKLGLPLVNEESKQLCDIAKNDVENFFPAGIGSILSWVAGAFMEAGSYCTGSPWETKILGFKRMYKPAKNGSPYLQVWALSIPGKYSDGLASQKVGLGKGPNMSRERAKALAKDLPTVTPFYAQAEFYYDCDDTFTSEACNGDPMENSYATFNMKWRARLRPVSLPEVGPFKLREVVELAERNASRFTPKSGAAPSREAVSSAGKDLRNAFDSREPGDVGKILH